MKAVTIKSIKTNVHSETKFLFWYVFGASRGGGNRIKIISFLKDSPVNTNKIAEYLHLDYKGVKHHLDVLEKNNLVTKIGERYGMIFFLSPLLEENIDLFEEIAEKLN
ncbi:MAG: ArsR family transcriptional regulator [Nitrosopumilus sp.]|nr:MAG: ArsR family transcriptional regulator [Nitrosopumilus sp.]